MLIIQITVPNWGERRKKGREVGKSRKGLEKSTRKERLKKKNVFLIPISIKKNS